MRLGVMRNRLTLPAANKSNGESVRLVDIDDADIAAGKRPLPPGSTIDLEQCPQSFGTINSVRGHPTELEFFEDLVSEPVLVLGMDISHLPRQSQFIVCAVGVFGFSLLYGYLQELIAVQICNRNLGLFQAMFQFLGYTVLAYVLRNFVYGKQERMKKQKLLDQQQQRFLHNSDISDESDTSKRVAPQKPIVPLALYLGLSLLRALDLAMTNLAMQYINYPAKTLMKSSRVVFTMLFGVLISRKTYRPVDYFIVLAMVVGLVIFMHADANSSAVFHHIGVFMLIVSLICDGAISNVSETIMNQFGVGQDEFIFRMYSIALVAITVAAGIKGDLRIGMYWLTQPGTYDEYLRGVPAADCTWTATGKIVVMVLFSSMGFFGSSCSAAITKNFGALSMSITSTARKAMTLFLSFFLFQNVCTTEHVAGIALFISALTAKSLRRRGRPDHKKRNKRPRPKRDRNNAFRPSSAASEMSHGADDETTLQSSPLLIQRANSRDSAMSSSSVRSRASRATPPSISVAMINQSGGSPASRTRKNSSDITMVHVV